MEWNARHELVGWRWMVAAGALAVLAAAGAALGTSKTAPTGQAVDTRAPVAWPTVDVPMLRVAHAADAGSPGPFAPSAPIVEQAPMPLSVRAGGSAMFLVRLEGTDPSLRFRWERNGATVHGADRSVIVLPAVTPADDGSRWRVRISYAGGEILTEEAVLSVQAAAEPMRWE